MKLPLFEFPSFIYQIDDWEFKKKSLLARINKSEFVRTDLQHFETDRQTNGKTYIRYLEEFLEPQLMEFCKEAKVSCSMTDAWCVKYQKGDYQEYHHHGGSMISVVYFLKVDEDSAKIYFKQPFIDMIEPRYKQFRDDTYQTVFYTPQPGMILIFRSYLEHCVEKHDNDSERITLSYNFRKK